MIYYIETNYINNLNQKEKDKWIDLLIKLETSDIASLARFNHLLSYTYLYIDTAPLIGKVLIHTSDTVLFINASFLSIEKLHELVLLKLIGN